MSWRAKATNTFGVLTVAICLVYLVDRLLHSGQGFVALVEDPWIWMGLVVVGLAYAALLGLPVIAWGMLLRSSLQDRFEWLQVFRIYGVANLGKFLPGNIFHFAGRQILAARLGWPQSAVAGATLTETLLQVITVSVVIAVASIIEDRLGRASLERVLEQWHIPWWVVVMVLLVGVSILLLAPVILRRQQMMKFQMATADVILASVLYMLFFVGNALLVSLAVRWIDVDGGSLSIMIGAGYLASWLVGFVTPGAPAGLGVREATFTLIMGPFTGTTEALAIVLFMRLVTTLGDGLLFAATYRPLGASRNKSP